MRAARRFARIEAAVVGSWILCASVAAQEPTQGTRQTSAQPEDTPAVPSESLVTPLTSPSSAAPAPAPVAPAPAPGSVPPPQVTPPGLAPSPAPAEAEAALPDGDIASLDLEELLNQSIVSASKREQALRDSPVSFSYLSADELEGTGLFSLCEAMQYFPGLECRRGAMRKAAVSARGLGSNFLSNRLLLLKDGRPETDPWTGIFYPDETTPLLNLHRIEVIRGPGSSLYGTNAFSGVINLITRKPSDLIREGRDFGGELKVLGGQNKTYRAQATAAGKVGDASALVAYHGYKTEGPELLSDPDRGIVDRNQDAEVQQVTGKALWKGLTLDLAYSASELGRPGGKQITVVGTCGRCHYTPQDSERVQGFQSSLAYEGKVAESWTLFAQAYGNFKRREVDLLDEFSGNLETSLGKRRRLGGEVRAVYEDGPYSLTVGVDGKRDGVNNTNVLPVAAPDGIHATDLGGFVDGEWRPTEEWTFVAGARYDHAHIPETLWQNAEAHVSPRAAIRYQVIPELGLRTSYGRAFRAPSLAELGIQQQMYAATLLGNPELRPETIDVVELSAELRPFGDTLWLTTTGFFKYAQDLIGQQLVAGSTSRFANVGNARVWGLETEARVQIPGTRTTLHGAYQLLDAYTLTGPEGQEPLDYAPTHRFSLRAHTRVKELFFFDVYGLYVGGRTDPGLETNAAGEVVGHVALSDYFVASARVGTELAPGLSFSLLGSNVFDAGYEESFGFPSPGRSLFGELKYVY